MTLRFRFRTKGSPRLSRCGRGCRRPDVDEMIYENPEKLSGFVSRRKRRAA